MFTGTQHLIPAIFLTGFPWGIQSTGNCCAGVLQTEQPQRIDVVSCMWPLSIELVGVTLYDVENNTTFVDIVIEPSACKIQGIAGQCILDASHATLKALVLGLQEGQTRTFGCQGTYFTGHFDHKLKLITVSSSGYTSPNVVAVASIWVVLFGTSVAVIVLCGTVICFCVFKHRGAAGRKETTWHGENTFGKTVLTHCHWTAFCTGKFLCCLGGLKQECPQNNGDILESRVVQTELAACDQENGNDEESSPYVPLSAATPYCTPRTEDPKCSTNNVLDVVLVKAGHVAYKDSAVYLE